MYSQRALGSHFSFIDIINTIKYNRLHAKENPDYFHPDGSIVFCGPQGSGKTMSAVRYLYRLKAMYPNALIVSNIELPWCDYVSFPGLSVLPQTVDNGDKGVIVFIDEIQTEFNSLESKQVSPSLISIISQQRKRRYHIVGTSQLFTRISKAFREQINAAVDCRSILDLVQRQDIIDFSRCVYDIQGNLTSVAYSKSYFYTRSPALYDLYDTAAVVQRVGNPHDLRS